jgi:hypothetical protein
VDSCAEAFPAIVDRQDFEKVQRSIRKRFLKGCMSDQFYINLLRRVLRRPGRLDFSELRIDRDTLRKRFGSVRKAFEFVGYRLSPQVLKVLDTNTKLNALRQGLFNDLQEIYSGRLKLVRVSGQSCRRVLEFEDRTRVSIHVCSYAHTSRARGALYWVLAARHLEAGYPTLVCLPDRTLTRIKHMYLAP